MTAGDHVASETGDRAWADLEALDKIVIWQKKSPDTAQQMIEIIRAERRHAHRMEWAHWARLMTGVVLGFGCVILMVVLSWHFVDSGAPQYGAIAAGAGTASIAAIFVTGKYVGRAPNAQRNTRSIEPPGPV